MSSDAPAALADPTSPEVPYTLTPEQDRFLADTRARLGELKAKASWPAAEIAAIAAAAQRRRTTSGPSGDLLRAVGQVEVHVGIDLDVPVDSRIPAVRYVKLVIKKLMTWYLRFIGYQISALGHSVASLGQAVAERVETIETDTVEARKELAQLKRRVAALEERLGTGGGTDAAVSTDASAPTR